MADVQQPKEENLPKSQKLGLLKNISVKSLLKWLVIFTYSWTGVYLLEQLFSDTTYAISTWIYFKLFGLASTVAYISLYIQVLGLIGEKGISPVKDKLEDFDEYIQQMLALRKEKDKEIRKRPITDTLQSLVTKAIHLLKLNDEKVALTYHRFSTIPTLFWFGKSDRFIKTICQIGFFCNIALMIGIGPVPVLVGISYLCYLSIFTIAGDFLSLQWDILLCESGLLSFFLSLSSYGLQFFHIFPSQAVEPSKICVFLIQWLLFRLMFHSGIVKLSSKDSNWLNLTAMNYHYFTQPLPTPSSHLMHNLPQWIHKWETFSTFFIELVLPFLFFAPLPLKILAVLGTIQLNLAISLTGNYGYFNLLTCVLSTLVLDDKFWTGNFSLFSFGLFNFQFPSFSWSFLMNSPLLLAVMALSIHTFNRAFRTTVIETPHLIQKIHKFTRPLLLVNDYGLFAVMTTKRIELIVEGSDDGEHWLPYEFKYKPGNINRQPCFIPGHMPRLDWMMWFLPFHNFPNLPSWFFRFLKQLWKSNETVLCLLESSPFPIDRPPKFLRVQAYDYTFTSRDELKKTGKWWRRTLKGKFIPCNFVNPKCIATESE